MKISFNLCALYYCGTKAFSQGGYCALNIGYGMYSMSELKESRDKSLERMPFDEISCR